ncbi:glycerate kinase [Nocardiopsis coralliicola]
MRIAVATDSFKGSLGSLEAGRTIADGLRSVLPGADVSVTAMADGGEGTLDCLLHAWDGAPEEVATQDAIGRPRTARVGLSADRTSAVVELAESCGLPLVSDTAAQPRRADTFGTGVLAAHALDAGAREILLCVGGSASTDGGTGLMRALGARFLDADGAELAPGGGDLVRLASIDDSGLHPAARQAAWRIACDVDNPLTGARGAAAVFGPQKGADPDDVAHLDRGLARLGEVLAAQYGRDIADLPGSGAAGGTPATLTCMLGAVLVPGARLVAEGAGLPGLIGHADLVVTGEGAFDSQSLDGKVAGTVAQLAAEHRRPVVVFAGQVGLSTERARAAGIAAAVPIAAGPAALADLVGDAEPLLFEAAARSAALLTALEPTA